MRNFLIKMIYIVWLLWIPCSFGAILSILKETKKKEDIQFGFFAQEDNVGFWGDTLDEVDDDINLKSGVNIPRARFYVRGKSGDWFYYFTYDGAEERVREAFIRYEEYKYARITLGQFKVPYSFWFLTSHAKLNYLEQALPTNAFNPGFRVALNVQFFPDPFTLSAGLVTTDVDNNIHNNHTKGHTPLAGLGRLTFSPLHREKEALHFAAATLFQDTDSLGRFRFRSFPEVQTYNNQFLVDTGYIKQCKNFFGQEVEAAVIMHSFAIEGEFYHTAVNRNPNDLNFEGFFITTDYFLTGENYIYNFKDGNVQGMSNIRHSYGAWQLAIRQSYVDLQDNGVHGGRERNTTFGLNWFPNDNLRFMLNYILVDTFPSDNSLNRYVKIIALRCQLSAEST